MKGQKNEIVKIRLDGVEMHMTEKKDKSHEKELKEMVNKRDPNEPVEKVLAIFCQRHGISLNTCHVYYDQLVKKGEIKEK